MAYHFARRSLYLKGHGDDPLVLTTEDTTYSVCIVESSNTVLLARYTAPDESAPDGSSLALVVEGKAGGHLQVRTRAALAILWCRAV